MMQDILEKIFKELKTIKAQQKRIELEVQNLKHIIIERYKDDNHNQENSIDKLDQQLEELQGDEAFEELQMQSLKRIIEGHRDEEHNRENKIRKFDEPLLEFQGNEELEEFQETLPFSSREDLQDFEKKIQLNKALKTHVVAYLSSFHLNKPEDEIRRILKEVFSHQLSKEFNYSGSGSYGKSSFKDLKLYNLIKSAVLANHKDLTEDLYKNTVKKWFNGSGDRCGGRRNRQGGRLANRNLFPLGESPALTSLTVAPSQTPFLFEDPAVIIKEEGKSTLGDELKTESFEDAPCS